MLENDNLQNADGHKEDKLNDLVHTEKESVEEPIPTSELVEETSPETIENSKDKTVEITEEVAPIISNNDDEITAENHDDDDDHDLDGDNDDDAITNASDKELNHVDSIEASNAEDAEDESNNERHELQEKDYHTLSMDELVNEFEGLIASRKIQTIKKHVDDIRNEFNQKYKELFEEKKEEFINDGGNEIDFYYTSDVKKRFNSVYKDYKNKLNAYYKTLENNLKANLENRLQIIEEIKGLINVEENINTTYKHFKDLQEQWRNAGPIPRDNYNNTWNTYHHHVEIFYDFLHLNRDLRDMDFKHNLEEKLKIIARAEELAQDNDVHRAFRELQLLHKIWKEELGPVDREYREDIWNKFSDATKIIHDKRQSYYEDLDKSFEGNLAIKKEIIAKIEAIANDKNGNHNSWQQKIKEIAVLREAFFKAGKVPKANNQETWDKFKSAVRNFNRSKNAFYKNLKKDQYDNLQKKLDLIKVAEDNKDSDDFETVTPLMKQIQNSWKDIGHVPKKDSNKAWKQFKSACNYYFDRLHKERKSADKELYEAFDKKNELLNTLKSFEFSDKPTDDIKAVKAIIESWKSLGHVPQNKRFIEGKFNKTLDGVFDKLKVDKQKVEMIKFENKLEALSNPDDTRALDNERIFIRKKIDEIKSEINQLENNLMFFSNVDSDNPLVKDVHKNIAKQKQILQTWKDKLSKIKDLY
ncbi:DUF349 domain-containing protein [Paucihalobacter sp.]|uniref:DUF349 domain-containing protein n=1 Tax=Paucihalobacter sp. TaxID=2850405 RepID=UPI002FDF884E